MEITSLLQLTQLYTNHAKEVLRLISSSASFIGTQIHYRHSMFLHIRLCGYPISIKERYVYAYDQHVQLYTQRLIAHGCYYQLCHSIIMTSSTFRTTVSRSAFQEVVFLLFVFEVLVMSMLLRLPVLSPTI